MPSDRARLTYDPTRKWRGLVAQQGRVTVEADWNEATTIDAARDRQITLDFVGPVGTPSTPTPGYVVSAVPQSGGAPGATPGDLTIGAGTLYVGGERLDLEQAVSYSTQPEWLDSSTSPLWVAPGVPAGGVTELVYLLAAEQEVSAVEDPALADVALGGPDTMQRLRIIQRFVRQTVTPVSSATPPAPAPALPGLLPLPRPFPPVLIRRAAQPAWWTELITAAPSGAFSGLLLDDAAMTLVSASSLQVTFQAGTTSSALGTATGYLGAENQLIRVMVASTTAPGGPDVIWGFDDASSLYRVEAEFDSSTEQLTLTFAAAPVDSYHYPAAGQVVELLRDAVWLTGQDYIASPTGFVSTVASGYDPTTRTVVIGAAAIDGSAIPGDYLSPLPVSSTPAPQITAVIPSTGAASGGTLVTVTGSGFTGAQTLSFGSTPASGLLVQSDTQLTAISPPITGATTPASVNLTVTTPLGTSAPSTFTYITPGPPTVTSLSPSVGVLGGGTVVTFSGSGFTGVTAVNFGTTPGSGLIVVSDEVLTVVTPPAPAGEVTVSVIAGPSTGSAQFTYAPNPPPQVTGVTPSSGGLAGGTLVTVTGSAFTGATEVDFGAGTAGTGLSVISDTELTVLSPPAPSGTSGPVDVIVKTPAGPSPTAPADQFVYQLDITGVSPAVGPPSGGTVVTITGSGLTGATAVSFGGVAATGLTVQSDNQLTVISPAGAGTVDVVVTAPGGSSPPGATARFSYERTPQLYLRVWQGVASPAGPAPAAATGPYHYSLGATGVRIALASVNGQYHPGDYWHFAVRPLEPATVYPARYLAAPQPPDGPRTWICPLAVLTWNADGAATVTSSVPPFWNLVTMTNAILSHVQLPAPVVASISPSAGSPSGGTVVTVKGSGFTGATTVYFGPTTSPGTGLSVLSDTELTVTSPAGSGIVDLRVITAGGESATVAADQFAYMGVTAVSPAIGPPAGGTPVTITGSGFTGATAVDFGPTPGTALNVVSDTEITVTAPAGNGLVDVTVTTAAHTSQPGHGDQFVYIGVTGVAPTGGPQGGGTSVTITGTGFSSLPVTAVSFGPFATTAFSVVNDTTISATTPAGTGTQPVTVTTALGSSSPGPATFAYQGKSFLKDSKDLRDTKPPLREKITEKVADKVTDKVADKVTEKARDKLTDKVSDIRPAMAQLGKPAEAKPPEGARGPGPSEPAPAGELPAPAAEEEQGQAFIAPEERPAVGGDIVDQEEDL